MNKKLLAVAVSAALVAPAAAMAEVTVYGAAQVEVASYSSDAPSDANLAAAGLTPTQYSDGLKMIGSNNGVQDKVNTQDNARGRVGVKASEDLGNGLKAIAQFEWKADTTTNNADSGSKAALTSRVSQVGLTGGFGTFVMGNLKSPYKYTGGVKYDAFVTTALEARGNWGMSGKLVSLDGTKVSYLGHNSFVNDVIAYASPKGPVTATVAYGPSENDGAATFAVKYSQGGMEAFVAYFDAGDRLNGGTTGNKADYTATKIGGQWKSGPHKISGQFEQLEQNNAAGTVKLETDVMFLGYQMKMGKNTFAVQWGNTDVTTKAGGVSASGDATYTALGVIHKMSKMTRVFAGYRDAEDQDSVVTVGLRKDFKS